MSLNQANMYDIEAHIAEIYDKQEDYTDDVELIRKLIEGKGRLKILEPFCGTGRILVPLAADGHSGTGIDAAQAMLDSARGKIEKLPAEARSRTELIRADVLEDEWPDGFDVVILGGNCLYELATAEEQDKCISRAAASLKPGGYVYLDNGHMEGALAQAWRDVGVREGTFPTGVCDDGTRIKGTMQTIWYDASARLVRFRRTKTVIRPDGGVTGEEWFQQKHPPSTEEMRGWLEKYGFTVEQVFGDHVGDHYSDDSNRAIFWARKMAN